MIKLIKINIVFHLGLVKEVLMCWLDLQTWTGPANSAAAQVNIHKLISNSPQQPYYY